MNKHFVIWGATNDGADAAGQPTKAAYVGAGHVMLISRRAIEQNDMPPAFQRFLTQPECAHEGCASLLRD